MQQKDEQSPIKEVISDRDLFYNARFGNVTKIPVISRTTPLSLEGNTTVKLGVGIHCSTLKQLPDYITCISFTPHFFKKPLTEHYFSELMKSLPESVKWVALEQLSKISTENQKIIFKTMPSRLNVYYQVSNKNWASYNESDQLSKNSINTVPQPNPMISLPLPNSQWPFFPRLFEAVTTTLKRKRNQEVALGERNSSNYEPALKRTKTNFGEQRQLPYPFPMPDQALTLESVRSSGSRTLSGQQIEYQPILPASLASNPVTLPGFTTLFGQQRRYQPIKPAPLVSNPVRLPGFTAFFGQQRRYQPILPAPLASNPVTLPGFGEPSPELMKGSSISDNEFRFFHQRLDNFANSNASTSTAKSTETVIMPAGY